MNRNLRKVLVFAFIGCFTAGCVESTKPLFYPNTSVADIPEGNYAVQTNYGGPWDTSGTTGASIRRAGRGYNVSWKSSKAGQPSPFTVFHVYPAENNYLVLVGESPTGEPAQSATKYSYFVFTKSDSAYMLYFANCRDLLRLRAMPETSRPTERDGGCEFQGREELVAALIKYASASAPLFRVFTIKN